MRLWGMSGLALAAILSVGMLAPEAFAQRGGRGGFGGFGGGPGGGSLGMLRDERVQKELELVGDQTDKIRELQERMGTEMREMFSGLRDLSDDERRSRFEQLREQMTAKTQEYQKEIDDILLPHQRDRLKQISLQQQMRFRGTSGALSSPELASELGITDEQKEKLAEVEREANEELRKKTEELRAETRKKVLAVLTPEQREKVEKLIGAPADLGGGQQFGGFGGRFGGRGQGGDRGPIQRPADGD